MKIIFFFLFFSLLFYGKVGLALELEANLNEELCIKSASEYHKVNSEILWAILKVESNFNRNAKSYNKNGTIDYGVGGVNSIHFKDLKLHGVNEENIKELCVGTFVAAWILSKKIALHGNSWFGVASYHSITPYYNNRYQILLKNALIEKGVINGMKQKIPKLSNK